MKTCKKNKIHPIKYDKCYCFMIFSIVARHFKITGNWIISCTQKFFSETKSEDMCFLLIYRPWQTLHQIKHTSTSIKQQPWNSSGLSGQLYRNRPRRGSKWDNTQPWRKKKDMDLDGFFMSSGWVWHIRHFFFLDSARRIKPFLYLQLGHKTTFNALFQSEYRKDWAGISNLNFFYSINDSYFFRSTQS